ncbi:uncharacterized protein LOC143220131 [Lasioglossum baleicum]|uniref:uncharacterized protein LOC143220131 n=1 Tax=Lasioglossum baleicum TaxID=434251 RepID=UPI003FCE0220
MVWWDTARNPIATPQHQGEGHVRFRWGGVVQVGCYVSPNRTVAEDEDCMDTRLDLRILNRGGASTYVRPAGESVVDTSFASPAALKRLTAWGVEEKIELLSDHIPILMRHRAPGPDRRRREEVRRGGIDSARRWQLQRMDGDAVHAADWSPGPAGDVDAQVSVLKRAMTEACDIAMPRATKKPPRSVYWCSVELTTLRESANRARRRYTRARRGRAATSEEESALRRVCRCTNKSLRRAIKKARSSEWKTLLETLHREPWGRPYRVVLGRVRRWAPPLTESMEPAFAKRAFNALFPASPGMVMTAEEVPTTRCEVGWTDDRGVTSEEMSQAIREIGARSKAPGRDGIPGRAWVLESSRDPLHTVRPGVQVSGVLQEGQGGATAGGGQVPVVSGGVQADLPVGRGWEALREGGS